MDKYTERLIKEWRAYGKIIIAVDYDSTISPYHTIDNKHDISRAISLITYAQGVGAYVIIHTCCDPDRFDEIKNYCTNNGIRIDSFNKNPIDLPFGNHGKPYANLILDDRAGFTQALDMLEYAVYTIAGEKNTQSVISQVF